jgi:hypothetical protein
MAVIHVSTTEAPRDLAGAAVPPPAGAQVVTEEGSLTVVGTSLRHGVNVTLQEPIQH